MATARINIKSIDYFKFKKIIIDGNRDDYSQCSKEVKSFCDSVQTLNFRDEQFDDAADRSRLEEICLLYKDILKSKRIDAVDMRIKSGWWGDHKNAYSAGKIKPAVLKEILTSKTQNWLQRHSETFMRDGEINEKLEGPGLYVFKHKEHQCFQFVGRAEKVIQQCGEKLKAAFEGASQDPLAGLLIISMSSDWDFYFIPVSASDDDRVLRILENDLILKHDCIWPHGLNFRVAIDSLLEVSEFRKSCLRHHWPPPDDGVGDLDLVKLRQHVRDALKSPTTSESSNSATPVKMSQPPAVAESSTVATPKPTSKTQVASPTPTKKSAERKQDRPKSASGTRSTTTSSSSSTKPSKPLSPSSSSSLENVAATPAPSKSHRPTTPKKIPSPPKPTSPAKKTPSGRPQAIGKPGRDKASDGSRKPPAVKSPVEPPPAVAPPPVVEPAPVVETPPVAVDQTEPLKPAFQQPESVPKPTASIPKQNDVSEVKLANKQLIPSAKKSDIPVVDTKKPPEVFPNERVPQDENTPPPNYTPTHKQADENNDKVINESEAPDKPKSTLKRSGTYEILPGVESGSEHQEEIQRPDVLDLPDTCAEKASGAKRCEKSKLPVSSNQ